MSLFTIALKSAEIELGGPIQQDGVSASSSARRSPLHSNDSTRAPAVELTGLPSAICSSRNDPSCRPRPPAIRPEKLALPMMLVEDRYLRRHRRFLIAERLIEWHLRRMPRSGRFSRGLRAREARDSPVGRRRAERPALGTRACAPGLRSISSRPEPVFASPADPSCRARRDTLRKAPHRCRAPARFRHHYAKPTRTFRRHGFQ